MKKAAKKTTAPSKPKVKANKLLKVSIKVVSKTKKTATVKSKKTSPTPANKNALKVGSPVPDFKMPATQVGEVSRSSLKGKPYVLYFYPKDDTSGCTAEACGFRDALPNFGKLKVAIIGVSKDDLSSHQKFSKKYDLTFPLASDATGKVCESFGVWVTKSMYGRTYKGIERSTFLVDAKGIVRAVWSKVSVPGHVDEVKKAITEL